VHRPRVHDADEEPSSRHRVGPWFPAIPVELAPMFPGGDTVAGASREAGIVPGSARGG
jgi:hypothetical protein